MGTIATEQTVQRLSNTGALTCSSLQLARQLDSCGGVVVMEVADSVIGFCVQMSEEGDGKQTNKFLGQLIN